MSDRLTAERLAKALGRAAREVKATTPLAATALREAASQIRKHLVPQWGEPTADGWYWCEELDDDAPPQLLRSYQPIRTNSNGTMTVDWDSPRKWQRWTIAGWVDLKGRVAPCVGRPRKAGSP